MNTIPRFLYMPLGPAAMIPDAAAVVAGTVKSISGGINLRKDKSELNRLAPAIYKVQDEYYNNNYQAAEMAQGGLTIGAKDYYSDMAGRGLGTGVSGVLQAGGSPNDISKIMDSYNQSIRGLGVQDAEAQIGNIKYFQQVGKDLAGQKTQQWAINEYAPYQNKLKELTRRIAADKQNIWGGIDQAIGAGQAGVTTMQNEDLINNLMKKGPSTVINNNNQSSGNASTGARNVLTMDGPYSDNGENYNRPGPNGAQKSNLNLPAMSKEELAALMQDIQEAFKSKE